MMTHTETIYGVKVTAYSDHNSQWVVQAGDMNEQRFDKCMWAMRDAMFVMAEVAAIDLD